MRREKEEIVDTMLGIGVIIEMKLLVAFGYVAIDVYSADILGKLKTV